MSTDPDRPDPTTATEPFLEDTMRTTITPGTPPDPTSPTDLPSPTGPTAPPQVTPLDEPRGPALGTLVWGCIALAVAVLLGAWELAGLRVDATLVVPVTMVVLGLLLVLGAVATALRRQR